jgi:4-amino-4-deoxy-L-arabinose transferase-like glycosyltransferase
MSENSQRTGSWVWPAVFCGYFAFQSVYRWRIGGGLGLDESQMYLWGQHLAWGYGPQPPLYSWLQWLAFHLIGDPLLALSLVKNALLCTTYLSVYALLRTANPPGRAGLATLGLMLLPQIAWESQRALSHSVLATSVAALTCLVFWTRTLPGRPGGYVLFGLLVGLGLISKANYAFVPPALCLAAATMPPLRRQIRPLGLLLGAGIAAALAAGPIIWTIRNHQTALASRHKLEMPDAGTHWIWTALEGLGAMLAATLLFVALPACLAALLAWRLRKDAAPVGRVPRDSLSEWMLRVVIAGALLALLMVLLSGTTQVKDRWMQPVLFLSGPLIALWLLDYVDATGRRWFARLAAACALLVTVALPVELLTGTPGNPARGGAPIGQIVPNLVGAFPDTVAVIAEPEWIAANLEYREPAWEAIPAHSARLSPGETALLVWTGDAGHGFELASEIGRRSGGGVELGEPVEFGSAYPWQPEIRFQLLAAPLSRAE